MDWYEYAELRTECAAGAIESWVSLSDCTVHVGYESKHLPLATGRVTLLNALGRTGWQVIEVVETAEGAMYSLGRRRSDEIPTNPKGKPNEERRKRYELNLVEALRTRGYLVYPDKGADLSQAWRDYEHSADFRQSAVSAVFEAELRGLSRDAAITAIAATMQVGTSLLRVWVDQADAREVAREIGSYRNQPPPSRPSRKVVSFEDEFESGS